MALSSPPSPSCVLPFPPIYLLTLFRGHKFTVSSDFSFTRKLGNAFRGVSFWIDFFIQAVNIQLQYTTSATKHSMKGTSPSAACDNQLHMARRAYPVFPFWCKLPWQLRVLFLLHRRHIKCADVDSILNDTIPSLQADADDQPSMQEYYGRSLMYLLATLFIIASPDSHITWSLKALVKAICKSLAPNTVVQTCAACNLQVMLCAGLQGKNRKVRIAEEDKEKQSESRSSPSSCTAIWAVQGIFV